VADEEQVSLLRKGVDGWNAWWREETHARRTKSRRTVRVNLRDADLRGSNLQGVYLYDTDLTGVDLTCAKLGRANLAGARLIVANLTDANLSRAVLNRANANGAIFTRAYLYNANLSYARLNEANLGTAMLDGAELRGANLSGANLSHASLDDTRFGNTNLTDVIGLETCEHLGPSIIDHGTLRISGRLPPSFLRGVGLPDHLIEYLRSLLGEAIHFFSCFISYSSHDDDFARRIHADLQNNGVRCWFAPHDLKIGVKILDCLDAAIRVHDKVLLILSEHSICSDWVEDEVKKAFEEERTRKQTVLFPIRLDDAVLETKEAWAGVLRRDRNIGDFRHWKDHDAYQRSFPAGASAQRRCGSIAQSSGRRCRVG
jgi:uncharacterized protein YjbI with pentapeptide repeats